MAFDPEQGREVISTWRDISSDAPEELGWAVAVDHARRPSPFVPVEWQGRRVWRSSGSSPARVDVAEKLMEPLRALKPSSTSGSRCRTRWCKR